VRLLKKQIKTATIKRKEAMIRAEDIAHWVQGSIPSKR
jgi:hypothetical protein